MKKENLIVIFYWGKEAVKLAEDFEFISIPRAGEKITFDNPKYSGEKIVDRIEHSYSDSPNLNHLITVYCK
jgi:hypothetical protein